ncbi:uncharacterized protein LOC135804496 [Sycon ciliatum]|uniref:uncharacterized protein LOC135804496 n=1 Tax=Sycon ciliatum TaxID=27933 RepID=UPI0031F7202B
MAALGSTTSGDRTQPELVIRNLPRRTKSKSLKSEMERHGVKVLRCQIKKPKSKRPYAFVRVASRADCDRALGLNCSMMLGDRLLKVDKSVRGGQKVITEPIDLEIHRLQSFSIGVFFLKQSMFLQRWSSLDGNTSISGDIKCTVNFRKGEIHLCFMTDEHEYKVQFFFKDMQYFLDLRVDDLPSDAAAASSRCASHGLVLAFWNAPLVFRKDRDIPRRQTAASDLATRLIMENAFGFLDGDEEDDDDDDSFGLHSTVMEHSFLEFLNMLEFDADDGEDMYHEDYFFLAGDVEEERDWRRTTGMFTQDPNIQGQYFHYLLTPQCEEEFDAIIKRMRKNYDGYEHYDELARIRRLNSIDLLSRSQYATLARRVPFQLMFLVEVMVSDGLLYRELMSELFFELLEQPNAYRCLRHYQQSYCYYLDQNGEVMEDPAEDFLKSIDLIHEGGNVGNSPQDDFAVDCSTDDHVMVHHATITPLLIYCYGPYLDTPNRVLRHYKHLSDRFLRVNFADEHREKLNVGKASRPLTEITDFIRKTLSEGIDVAGRHYDFLAMSNSQLRENSCWFFSSDTEARRPSVTAADIRNWMGDFSTIKNVAKYAARMGQCFSCTSTSGKLTIDGSEFKEVPDVKTRDGKYTFSDGIGMISPSPSSRARR